MKKPEGDELTDWIKDVSSLSGKEIIILRREEKIFATHLAEKLLIVTVLIALTFAVSATVYLAAPLTSIPTTTTTTTTTSSSTTTIPVTTTTTSTSTTEEPTTTTTTTTSTTTTTIACGGDLQPPCIYENGPKCDGGIILGADEICHKTTHTKSVVSGADSGTSCGAWALDY
jgi:cytoskeletal protein RodZ